MDFDLALRLTEILLGFAFLQSALEHASVQRLQRLVFTARAGLSLLLMAGLYTPLVCVALFVIALFMLARFQGPYNGGSDRMGILILSCLTLTHFVPAGLWQEVAFGYLALQLLLSYFIAGWVKVVNPAWRSGKALEDVFAYSAYPVSESLRGWAARPHIMLTAGWAVMLFELLFPLSLMTQATLILVLGIAAAFHLANACLFGLNRFFWIWIAAYPSILWLQERLLG